MKLLVSAVCSVLALAGGGTAWAMASSGAQPAPSEDYVREDGTVDMSKVPATITMVDKNGNTVVDAEGNPVLLDYHRLLGSDGSDPFAGKFPVPKPHTIVDNGKEVTAYEGQIIPREDVIREYQYRGK